MMWKNGYRVSRRPASAWWNDMWRLNQQMDHFFGGTLGPIQREYPLIEAWSGENGLILAANMPGVDEDALEITVDGRTLTLSGNRPGDDWPEEARIYRQERTSGQFTRSIELPFDVDIEAVKATYANGVLEIELPRVPEEKPRKISVNNG